MDINLKEIRKKSIASIKGNISAIAIMILILSVINAALTGLANIGILSIFSTIGYGFVFVIISIFGLKVYRNDNPDYLVFRELFDSKKSLVYIKSMVGNFLFQLLFSRPLMIISAIFMIIFFGNIIEIIIMASSFIEIVENILIDFIGLIIVLTILSIFFGIIIYIIKMSFQCVYYIAFDAKEDVSITNIFSLSHRMMSGKRLKYFFLDIRFVIMYIVITILFVLSFAFGMMHFIQDGGFFRYFGAYCFIIQLVYWFLLILVSAYRNVCFAGFYEQLLMAYDNESLINDVYGEKISFENLDESDGYMQVEE